MVLTLGADGAIYATKENDEICHIRPNMSKNLRVLDTTVRRSKMYFGYDYWKSRIE